MSKPSLTTEMQGMELLDAVFTHSEEDAHEQLMHRTGEFLNILDHVARNHPGVITGEYLGDVLDDVDHIALKYGLPEPVHPGMQ